jgi:manganese transport protein
VNAAILILAAAVFFKRQMVVTEIQQAHQLLSPLLGTALASVLFAVALMCSGLSSTMTGTMAGQIVMEGFLRIRMRPWLRRLTTRMAAIVPAAITIAVMGEQGSFRLLILSQVILSLQLPFAVIPLIHFTSDRKRMGEFTSPVWVRILAWVVAAIIVALNVRLAWMAVGDWLASAGPYRPVLEFLVVPLAVGLFCLLVWIVVQPWLPRWTWKRREAVAVPEHAPAEFEVPLYRTILVPLDHTERDREAVSHASALAKLHGATLYLLHVEEDVTSQMYGPLASTAEVQAGVKYLEGIVASLRAKGIQVKSAVRYSRDPKSEIVRYAREVSPDLLIMGAHGHRGIKDLVYGQTIDGVRHAIDTPILIVRGEKRPQ